ncbi:MAG TPA: methyltransferase domain-containing protein [Metalysinibacillus jejuensis]|uniref:Methyltransferase domain-containing protein n=1 Tax=Metalysinibacillus jejuensis TaxID=914327 RepID=A0A921NC94_9BACL|nr:methyltransferase domain-containing protein [Metalysinibacillus jejuensis]
MKLQRVLPYAQQLITQAVTSTSHVIDATAGNGHDTLFLAELVPQGHVYAFDVQEEALKNTKERLGNLQTRVTLIHDGHENVANYIKQPISAAIFNLGYLPGGDHSIITTPKTTLRAIDEILDLLEVGGVIVLVIYHGHEGGATERDAIVDYVSEYDQKYIHVLQYQFLNQLNSPPFVIALEKTKAFPQ